jgi:hypothetical protein
MVPSTARRANLLSDRIGFSWKSYKKREEFSQLAHPTGSPPHRSLFSLWGGSNALQEIEMQKSSLRYGDR